MKVNRLLVLLLFLLLPLAGLEQTLVIGDTAIDCSDSDYALLHPVECGTIVVPPPVGCSDPDYALLHPVECGTIVPPCPGCLPPADAKPTVSIDVPDTPALNAIEILVSGSDDVSVNQLLLYGESGDEPLLTFDCAPGLKVCSHTFLRTAPSLVGTIYTYRAQGKDSAGQFSGFVSDSGVTLSAGGGGGGDGGDGGDAPPDLIVQSLTYFPAAPVAGDSMTFSGTVKNQGSGVAAPSETRLRIDVGNDGTWDVNPAGMPTGTLAPGATEVETWSTVWTATAGTHLFMVCADYTFLVAESNETNNCITQIFTVQSTPPSVPDLVVQSVTYFPAAPVAGDSITFSGTVKNQGSGSAAPSETRLRIDVGNDGTWDVNPAGMPTGTLAPGATEVETWSTVWTATAGTHLFMVCADYTFLVTESNETNNCITQTFTVQSAPPPSDAAPSVTISVPSSAAPGSEMSISVTGSDDVDVSQLLLFDADNVQLAAYDCSGLRAVCSIIFSATAPLTANTAYTFKAQSKDSIGQFSQVVSGSGMTTVVPVEVDDAPSVTISVPSSAAPGSELSISVTGSDDVDVSQLLLFDADNVQLAAYDCSGLRAVCSIIFSATAPLTANTAYTFKAQSKDSIGQFSQVVSGSGMTTGLVPVDAAPSVTISVPSSAAPGSQLGITVTGTDDNDVLQLLLFDANNVQLAAYDCTGVQTTCSIIFSVTAPLTSNTAYTFMAQSEDSASQFSEVVSGSGTTTGVPVSDAVPSVTISVPSAAAPGSQLGITVTGTDDNDVLQLLLFDANNVQLAAYDCTGVQTTCSIVFSVAAPLTSNTAYTFMAQSEDSASQFSQVVSGSGTTTGVTIPPPTPVLTATSTSVTGPIIVELPEQKKLFIRSGGFPESDCINPGESAWFAVQVENTGRTTLKDVKFAATVTDLAIYSSDGPTVLYSHDKSLHWFNIEVPEDASEETHYLRLEVGNNAFKRVVYRTFVVDSSC